MPKHHRLIVLCLGLLFMNVDFAFCQGQMNQWYFGYKAGLDFNTGTPVPITNSATYGREGCASIADWMGQTLFYTEGVTVWNRNNKPMPNGTGLMGNQSTTQSAMIVQQPGSDSIYYIFTNDCVEYHLAHGLQYNILNMNADTGRGDIILKNQVLNTSSAEKQIATRHANGKDAWIITHSANGNLFNIYALTDNGLNTVPIKSYTGSSLDLNSIGTHPGNFIGYMTISPDGSKVANALFESGKVELFSFDNKTGSLQYLYSISCSSPYGLCFSPNNNLLYVNCQDPAFGLMQFDISSGDATQIAQSVYTIRKDIYCGGGLKIGPDNKIYATLCYSNKMMVFNNPDNKGNDCNAGTFNIVNKADLGLPNMLPANNEVIRIEVSNCHQDSVKFKVGPGQPDSALWNFGDQGAPQNTSRLINPIHVYSKSGKYEVTFTFWKKDYSVTIKKEISIDLNYTSIPDSLKLCNADSQTISISKPANTYKWQDSSTNSFYTIKAPGTYFVTTKNHCGTHTDTIHVLYEDCTLYLYVPNAFSPNGDGINEVFKPSISRKPKDYSMMIYNRWGELVFSTTNYNEAWDGTFHCAPALEDVYKYLIKAIGNQRDDIYRSGTLQLLRR